MIKQGEESGWSVHVIGEVLELITSMGEACESCVGRYSRACEARIAGVVLSTSMPILFVNVGRDPGVLSVTHNASD
jgi:hypothetical protein